MTSVESLMKESKIEIDDVRWYLTILQIQKMIHLQQNPFELAQYIYSKTLEAELYEMEQRYIDRLQEDWNNRRIDEAAVREILYQINREKKARSERRIGRNLLSKKK